VNPVIIGDATLYIGDCLEVMSSMTDSSVDSIVTDPPYELGFMGKSWDASGIAYNVDMWREALRVLKPGGHLLAFSGSRTYHRMTCAIEDAGFEIRDQIMWVYGSGFPKSLDVSKAIDKTRRRDYVLAAVELGLTIPGNNLHDWTKAEHAPGDKWWSEFKAVLSPEQWGEIERAVIGQRTTGIGTGGGTVAIMGDGSRDITAPATGAARQWEGWGTALKPAHEPICVARKPLVGTVAANVLEFGTGALNIDGCRVGTETISTHSRGVNGAFPKRPGETSAEQSGRTVDQREKLDHSERTGRWPANLIHDGSDEVCAAFPDAKGQQGRSSDSQRTRANTYGELSDNGKEYEPRGDTGSGARFFYCAKASKSDRGEGNTHPTVKPTELMCYLVRLVTPPGGLVLDPFMGSGSTGKAVMREGLRFVGVDMTPEYVGIAAARIKYERSKAHLDVVVSPNSAQGSLFEDCA
jgi:DNA modification methylase